MKGLLDGCGVERRWWDGMGWDGMLGVGCCGWGSRFINREVSLYQKDGKNSSLTEELGRAK